ncbi:putative pyridoxal kinase [Ancylostoma ceylanicum]|uniref:Pyridoxal kinase n=1 Tax=Ancylostoma ceylanicum TaxID=53326 RepID=A0A0D6MCG5_9BILA|nr:putative pyridoxal kinase [Ancylostoma ceylanicum]
MSLVEEALSRERDKRLNGFEVDPINSVQFSNHAGNVEFLNLPKSYKYVKGQRLTDLDLSDLYEGLKLNEINEYTHILTGYCGNAAFLTKIADIVKDLKSKDPSVLFVCDPVMGDNGMYYVPKELLPVYRDVVVPLANVLTPNAFELGEIVGFDIVNEEDCIRGMDIIHNIGVETVVVTSGVEGSQGPDTLCCFASTREFCNAASKSTLQMPPEAREGSGFASHDYVGNSSVLVTYSLLY